MLFLGEIWVIAIYFEFHLKPQSYIFIFHVLKYAIKSDEMRFFVQLFRLTEWCLQIYLVTAY